MLQCERTGEPCKYIMHKVDSYKNTAEIILQCCYTTCYSSRTQTGEGALLAGTHKKSIWYRCFRKARQTKTKH